MSFFKNILIVLGFALPLNMIAQNLAPNPDFEILDSIKKVGEEAKGWKNVSSSKSNAYYYNDKFFKISLLSAHSGNGCWEMWLYPASIPHMIEAKLLQPLKKDSIYKVTLYEQLDKYYFLAVYGFPVFFSDSNLTKKRYEKLKPIYLFNKTRTPLVNKETWEQVTGYYKAKGGEQYIHVGVYSDNEIIKTENLYKIFRSKEQRRQYIETSHASDEEAYYHIDDVSVEMVNSKGVQTTDIKEEKTERDTIQKKIDTEGIILWNGYLLTWNDFKGPVLFKKKDTNEGAEASLVFFYQKGIDKKNSIAYVDIKAGFVRTKSWVKKEAKSDFCLKHEQTHFDIAEIFARRFRKEIKETLFKNFNVASKVVEKRYKYYYKEFIKYENQYDEETNHSRNANKQIEWNKKVEDDLKELDSYSETRVNINAK